MDENKTTVPAATTSTEAAPIILTQDELDAKAAQERAAQAVAAAEGYAQAVRDANLGVTQSLIVYNNAKTYAAWGIGIGAVTAGVGILLGAFRH
jgi:predicted hotdog family 3-hydroxylacyl-ACP dehydratase